MLCSTTRTVCPVSLMARRIMPSSAVSASFIPAPGSSNSTTLGLRHQRPRQLQVLLRGEREDRGALFGPVGQPHDLEQLPRPRLQRLFLPRHRGSRSAWAS